MTRHVRDDDGSHVHEVHGFGTTNGNTEDSKKDLEEGNVASDDQVELNDRQ